MCSCSSGARTRASRANRRRSSTILGDPGVQQLDRDVAAQAPVACAPDRSHAAFADAGTQLVAAGDEVGHTRGSARVRATVRRSRTGTVAADPRPEVVRRRKSPANREFH